MIQWRGNQERTRTRKNCYFKTPPPKKKGDCSKIGIDSKLEYQVDMHSNPGVELHTISSLFSPNGNMTPLQRAVRDNANEDSECYIPPISGRTLKTMNESSLHLLKQGVEVHAGGFKSRAIPYFTLHCFNEAQRVGGGISVRIFTPGALK